MSLTARISRIEAQAPTMPHLSIVAADKEEAERQIEDAFLSAKRPFAVALTAAGRSEEFTVGQIAHEDALQELGS
ncbi:hypothetical protein [Mesorhizobium sp. 1B3]|uniref:hypothetical protein n=1 Tax=Mesorhizobium sp. 1B3 TaxID=3243599 RepID=UPI003D967485